MKEYTLKYYLHLVRNIIPEEQELVTVPLNVMVDSTIFIFCIELYANDQLMD